MVQGRRQSHSGTGLIRNTGVSSTLTYYFKRHRNPQEHTPGSPWLSHREGSAQLSCGPYCSGKSRNHNTCHPSRAQRPGLQPLLKGLLSACLGTTSRPLMTVFLFWGCLGLSCEVPCLPEMARRKPTEVAEQTLQWPSPVLVASTSLHHPPAMITMQRAGCAPFYVQGRGFTAYMPRGPGCPALCGHV